MKDLSECRVLIVDDDRSNVDMLVEALRRDYRLSVALDGRSALGNIRMSPPDLVLLDIVMPGMDGYEVCRQLRSAPATRDVPVLFLSGLEHTDAKVKGFEAGGTDYVTKPFEMVEVQARVRSLLKAKEYADVVKEQWASELRIARDIQEGLLPTNLNQIAQGSGLDIDGLLQPARGVSGDFYEVFRTSSGQVVFVVGEVAGQGIPAALLMAVTLTIVRLMAGQFHEPAVILRWVSDALAVHGTKDLKVTLFCGAYDAANGELAYCSAGSPAPIVRLDGRASSWPQESSEALGSERGFLVSNSRIPLRPGDSVLLYTKGALNVIGADGEPFGVSRMVQRLDRSRDETAAQLVANMLKGLQNHMKDRPQSEDFAFLAMQRTK